MLRNAVSHSWNKLKTRSTEQSSRTPHHVWFNKAECVFPVGDTSLSLGLSRRRLPQVRPLTMPSILKGLLSTTADDDWAYFMGITVQGRSVCERRHLLLGEGTWQFERVAHAVRTTGFQPVGARLSHPNPRSPAACNSFGLIVRAFPNPSMAFDLSRGDKPPGLSDPPATPRTHPTTFGLIKRSLPTFPPNCSSSDQSPPDAGPRRGALERRWTLIEQVENSFYGKD